MPITAAQLTAVMPKCPAALWETAFNEAMDRFEINTPNRIAAFCAQVALESGETTRLTENLSYTAQRLTVVWPGRFPTLEAAQPYERNPELLANFVYAGRGGNNPSGDGWRYRGRGLFQLTFKDNYRLAGTALNLPLVDNPDLVATPNVAALTAAQYWSRLGLNALADHQPGDNDEKDFDEISIRINGARTGLPERKRYWAVAQRVLTV